jgi:hypothetical protein
MTAGVAASDGPGGERPLIICGMHRSGTSFVASLVAGAGVHLGDELLESSPGNPRGHFEDVGILDFHRTVLIANGIVSPCCDDVLGLIHSHGHTLVIYIN